MMRLMIRGFGGFKMDEYPWLKQYDEGVANSLQPYPEQTLLDFVSDTARQRPDHTALIFKGTRLSYGELERLSDAFANALVARGIKKGDRVALLLPNCPQFVIAQLGIWKAGGIVAPLNPLYTEHELERLMRECGAETVVVLTLVKDGRLVRLRIHLPDHPGALEKLAGVIAAEKANIVETNYDRAYYGVLLGDTVIDITMETRGPDNIAELTAALDAAGYSHERVL